MAGIRQMSRRIARWDGWVSAGLIPTTNQEDADGAERDRALSCTYQHPEEPNVVRIFVYGLLAILVCGAAALVIAERTWSASTARIVAHIAPINGAPASDSDRVTYDQISDLPAPVQRFVRFAIPDGTARAQHARIEHAGQFAMKRDTWSTFTSIEFFRVQRPAFVWDARIQMFPGMSVRVRDNYVDQQGSMRAAVGALVNVAHVHGTAQIAEGALARFLAELAWVPTSLVPTTEGGSISWNAIDDSTACATIKDGTNTVSVNFHFASDGRIERISGLRYRDVDGVGVLTPWQGNFSEYQRVSGVMIPMSGDVAWILPDGAAPYWRGRIVSVRYN